jgi:hypothetical protein
MKHGCHRTTIFADVEIVRLEIRYLDSAVGRAYPPRLVDLPQISAASSKDNAGTIGSAVGRYS